MPRLSLRALVSGALLATALSAQPNVLIVTIDDWGMDNSALYATGSSPPPTPRIDALAASGVVFDNFWAATMCSPTRAQLLTGRHGFRTGVRYVVPDSRGLSDGELTLVEHLRDSGLPHTAGVFGKWHLNDIADGVDAARRAGFVHHAGTFYGLEDYFRWQRIVNGVPDVQTSWATTVHVDDALAWIRTRTGPWFCWLTPISAHSPYQAPPAHLHTQNLTGLDPTIDPRPFYRAMVEATDTEIGRLLDGLGPALANTLVIVMSDNGTPPEVVEAGLDPSHAKGSPYEPGIRIPMLVRGPGIVQPGRRITALTAVVDVFATVSELLGAPPPPSHPPHDGISFAGYLRDPHQPPRRSTALSELFVPVGGGATCGFQTVRDARFKLIRRVCSVGAISEALHDLVADPLETVDLLRAPLHPEARAALPGLRQALDDQVATDARFERFGLATCAGTAGSPRIRGVGRPRLGQPYAVAVDGAPAGAIAICLTGSSERSLGGLPLLPFDLARIGSGPGCALWVSNDALDPQLTGTGGIALHGVPLPDDPRLIGATVLHQWLVVDAGANRLGLTTSDALRARIGR